MSKKTQEMIDEELESLLLDELDIEEEEEEEEDEEFDEEEDRGDDVDPDLPDDDDDEQDEEEEPDAEAEPEEDLDPDALAELAGDDDKRSKSVPHARFNEVNESLKQERAARLKLEEELARANGRVKPDTEKPTEPEAPAFDFKAKRKEMRAALYEGDDDKADALQEEIDAAKEAELERKAEERAEALFNKREKERADREAEAEAQRAQDAVGTAAAKAYEAYPFLNPEGADHDPEALEEVVAWRDYYINKGVSPDKAIEQAAAKIGPRYAEPEVEKIDKSKGKPSLEQLKRNDERREKIPPRDGGTGERATKTDFAALTEDEYDNLSEADKKKARGDYVG